MRATLFILDQEDGSLWSYIAGGHMISVPNGEGLAGLCVSQNQVINVDDCQNDARFGGDKETGFTTESVLCCPVRDNNGNIYGCLQVINKSKTSNDTCFNAIDHDILVDFGLNVGPVVKSWMAFFDTKNVLEKQLNEAVSGERKMAELIAFLLQVGGTPLREAIGEDLAIELLSHASDLGVGDNIAEPQELFE